MDVAECGGHDDGRARGLRRSVADVRRRLQLVEKLLIKYMSTSAVLRAARSHGLPTRTTERYLRRVRLLWEREAEKGRPHLREEYRRRLVTLANAAQKRGRYAAAATALRLRAEIDGVRAPEKVDLTVKDEFDLSELSDGAFREVMELRARRAAGRTG